MLSVALQSVHDHPNQSGICRYLASVEARLINTEPSLELQAAGSARLGFILWKSFLHLASVCVACVWHKEW